MDPEPRINHFSWTPSLASGGLGPLRRSFARWLQDHVPDARVRSDLVLAASELCATALKAAAASPEPPHVSMRAWIEGAAVVIEIHDPAGGIVHGSVLGLDNDDTNRGLSVAASVADVLTVRLAERQLLFRVRKERVAVHGLSPIGSG